MNTRFEEFSDLGFQLGNEDDVNLIFRLEMNEPPTRCLILIQDKSLVQELSVEEDLVAADLVVVVRIVVDRVVQELSLEDLVVADCVVIDLIVADLVVTDIVVADRVVLLHFSMIVEIAEWESELVELIEALLVNFPIDHQRERHGHVCNGVVKNGFDQLKCETSQKLLFLK
jgi:hypothetical protein